MFLSFDLPLALGGLLAGTIVGLTGMGGGAVLTPLLVLAFGIDPVSAVSNDLLVSLAIKPFGAGVHFRHGTVRWDIVTWLAVGSVPGAFAGAVLFDIVMGPRSGTLVRAVLGGALLAAASGMVVRMVMARRSSTSVGPVEPSPVRRVPTVAIGLFVGVLVGLTSIGSGSLAIVLLLFTYPRLSMAELVGTDLAQAVPLVASAALGHVLFGSVHLPLVASLLVGALPGVIIGSRLSARAPDRVMRPAVTGMLFFTGLKLLSIL